MAHEVESQTVRKHRGATFSDNLIKKTHAEDGHTTSTPTPIRKHPPAQEEQLLLWRHDSHAVQVHGGGHLLLAQCAKVPLLCAAIRPAQGHAGDAALEAHAAEWARGKLWKACRADVVIIRA